MGFLSCTALGLNRVARFFFYSFSIYTRFKLFFHRYYTLSIRSALNSYVFADKII